jgi:hypothetical protein
LSSLESVTAIPANICTLFSEGKESTSKRPGDICGKKVEICAPDGRSDIELEFTTDRRFDRDGVKAILMASPTMAHLSQPVHRFTFSEVCERIPGFEEP